jgi:hypothetical protein
MDDEHKREEIKNIIKEITNLAELKKLEVYIIEVIKNRN